MTNIAEAIKSEVSRLARKEVRAQLDQYKKANTHLKGQVTALRDEIGEIKGQLKALVKLTKHLHVEQANQTTPKATRQRFTAKGLTTMRERLALSFEDMGALLEASGQSVRKWEDGTAFPREKSQQAYFTLRGVGKREAAARLAAIRSNQA